MMKFLKTSGQDKLKLPYKLRSNQQKIIDTIVRGLNSKNHVVIEAPTGSGKTFTSLASALPFVTKNNYKQSQMYNEAVILSPEQEKAVSQIKEKYKEKEY